MHGHEAEFACCSASRAIAPDEPRRSWKPFPLPGAPERWSRDREFDVRHVRIEIEVDPPQRRIAGTATHTVVPFLDGLEEAVFDCAELTVARVTAAGRRCRFTHQDGKLRVALPESPRRGRPLEIVVEYSGTPRRGIWFTGPDEHFPGRPVQVWTQGQDEDSRYWFPCFDYPNEKQTSEVVATVPAGLKALSNGALVSHRRNPGAGTETWHYRLDVPHVAYLVTLVVGEFEVLETKWRGIPVTYWSPPGRMADVKRTLARTKRMLTHFSERTGVRFPYPQYAQVFVQDFIFGGMENTSATTLTDTAILDREAEREVWMDGLVAHELAHQWFGDLVTCRDWSHGWLNEGFATFMETVWMREHRGPDEEAYYRLGEQQAYLEEDGRSYRRPIVCRTYVHPIEVFDRHLYQKGGVVLHMLAEELGEELFWECVKRYLERHAWQSVVTDDLRRAIEDTTGRNLEAFFDQWVFHGGHPDLEVQARPEPGGVALVVRQRQPRDELTPIFRFHANVRLETTAGPVERRLEVTEPQQTFHLPAEGKLRWIAFDPGGHVLWSGKVEQSDDAWTGALAEDSDAVTRVRAARALAERATPAAVAALTRALAGDALWFVRSEAASALGTIGGRAAREALAAGVRDADPRVRRAVALALGQQRREPEAAALLLDMLQAGEKSPGVLHDAAIALGRTRLPEGHDTLLRQLHRPAWNDMARRGALVGLGELGEDRGLETVLGELALDRPEPVRTAAALALSRLGRDLPSDRDRVRERLEELVRGGRLRTQMAAAAVLVDRRESRAVATLRKQAERDLDGRVVRTCRLAVQALASGRDRGEDVRKLQTEVERLHEEQRRLRERLESVERSRPADGRRGEKPPVKRPRKRARRR